MRSMKKLEEEMSGKCQLVDFGMYNFDKCRNCQGEEGHCGWLYDEQERRKNGSKERPLSDKAYFKKGKEFCVKVRDYCFEHRIRIRAIEKLLGWNASYFSQTYSGHRRINLDEIHKIEEFLGVKLYE